MEKFYNKKLHRLEADINELDVDYSLQQIEIIIETVLKCLAEIKARVLQRGFDDMDEEIRFFKYQKPNIVAKLIYYNAIYKIETKRPYETKRIKKYFTKELKKLKKFFENNLDFYKYYRSNNSFHDENYFVRGKHDIRLWLDTFYFEADHCFSTSHDYKIAKIIANDLTQLYLEDRLNNINVKKATYNSL